MFKLLGYNIKQYFKNWKKTLEYFQILLALLYVRFLVSYIPLRKYYKSYFGEQLGRPDLLQPYYQDIRNIKKISKLLPFNVTCLMESMTVQLLLRKKHIYCKINIGVRLTEQVYAHAWYCEESSNNWKKLNI